MGKYIDFIITIVLQSHVFNRQYLLMKFWIWILDKNRNKQQVARNLLANHLILVAVIIFPFLEVCFAQHTIQPEFLKLLVRTIHRGGISHWTSQSKYVLYQTEVNTTKLNKFLMPAGNAMQSLHFDFFFPFTWFLPSLHPNVHEQGAVFDQTALWTEPYCSLLCFPPCVSSTSHCSDCGADCWCLMLASRQLNTRKAGVCLLPAPQARPRARAGCSPRRTSRPPAPACLVKNPLSSCV